jgi:NAD(P)H dehydrogenase (quinone)
VKLSKPTILVTGATGKTGSATAVQLLSAGYPVRAFVHRQDARSERLRTAGAEMVCGSLKDFSDIQSALQGVQRAYFCPPLEYGTLRRASLFAAAAQSARLEVVVALSQWAVDPCHQAVHSREKWLSDQIFAWMPDVDVVTINPGFLADNYMAALDSVSQLGLFGMPLGEGMNAPPSNEDVARSLSGRSRIRRIASGRAIGRRARAYSRPWTSPLHLPR